MHVCYNNQVLKIIYLKYRGNLLGLYRFIPLDNLNIRRIIPETIGLNLLPVSNLARVPPFTHKNILLLKALRFRFEVVLVGHDDTLALDLADGDGAV